MRLPAVGSKRFLTTKVDRCVTGLIAQQQCVGPLQLPLADVAVVAQSHFDLVGTATSIGEQPYKVRMALVENAACFRKQAASSAARVRVCTSPTLPRHVRCLHVMPGKPTLAVLLAGAKMRVHAMQGLLNPAAMARMALGEALTNLMWARVTALADVKASVNWMYAAKLGSEGAAMYDAAVALKCGAKASPILASSVD